MTLRPMLIVLFKSPTPKIPNTGLSQQHPAEIPSVHRKGSAGPLRSCLTPGWPEGENEAPLGVSWSDPFLFITHSTPTLFSNSASNLKQGQPF